MEDLVLIKRDRLEISMRRTGYLHYTNKTAYGIIEDRYTDKAWKVGEKYTSSTSLSNGRVSFAEEKNVMKRYVPSQLLLLEDCPCSADAWCCVVMVTVISTRSSE